jgi:hypothetical protein
MYRVEQGRLNVIQDLRLASGTEEGHVWKNQ